jgi:2-polyprenyl-3-methyl-5-hydroxy-6-metoxy-1,4-benzoquinol methylase
MTEFDLFAKSYRELVDESVRVSGESAEYFAAYKARYIASTFESTKVKTVLDYGCGIGALAEQLKFHIPVARIDGFDPSEDSLRRIAPSLLKQGIYTSNPDSLENPYDLIVISNVLHHVPPVSRPRVIAQAFSKLAPDGRLVIFEHNPINPLTRWAVSQCPFDGDAILLKNSEVRSLLEKSELQKLRRDFIVFFPHWLAALRPIERHLSWLPFGAQFVFSGVRGHSQLVHRRFSARAV